MIINSILAAESIILLIMSICLVIGTWKVATFLMLLTTHISKRISMLLLVYLLLAGVLIAVTIGNGVLIILNGGLGVGLSHMILTVVISVYFWIVVFSYRL